MLWKAMVLSLMQIQVVWFYYQNKLSGLPEWGLDNHKNLCRMLPPCMEVVLLCVRPFEEPSWWTMQTSTLHGKPKVGSEKIVAPWLTDAIDTQAEWSPEPQTIQP